MQLPSGRKHRAEAPARATADPSECDHAALREALDDTTGRAWVGFLRAYRAVVGDLDTELQHSHHLPLSEFDVLAQLSRAPDHRLRMTELADAVLLSPSGLTRLVERLERAGLVERRRCPSDRRGWHCQLTEHGTEVIQATRLAHMEGVQRRFAAVLSERELELLAEVFERLAAAGTAAHHVATPG